MEKALGFTSRNRSKMSKDLTCKASRSNTILLYY